MYLIFLKILLKWLAQRNVAIVPKSVTPSRIAENINVNLKMNIIIIV